MTFYNRTSRLYTLTEGISLKLRSNRLSGDDHLVSDKFSDKMDDVRFSKEGAFRVSLKKKRKSRTEGNTFALNDIKGNGLDGNEPTSLFLNSYAGSNVKHFFKSLTLSKKKSNIDSSKGTIIVKKSDSKNFPIGFLSLELGKSYEARGNHRIALLYFDKALHRQRQKFGSENPLTVKALLHRIRMLHKLGYTSKCLKDLKRAASIQVTCLSDETINNDEKMEEIFLYTDILIHLGRLQVHQNKSEAYGNLFTALSFLQKYLGENHLDVAQTWYIIGYAYQQNKEYKYALNAYQRSLRIYELANVPQTYPPVLAIRKLVTTKSMYHHFYSAHWEDDKAI